MPEQFGPYRLDRLLGRGGMGEVWEAFDTKRKRAVALKRLRPEFAVDESFSQRFRRESELAASLNHPHIIPIHDYGEIDGTLAYLIDFGVSRSVSTSDGHTITGSTQVIGTPYYIAPERFERAPDNRRMDIYSLACVLFEALTNQKAFPDGNKRDEDGYRRAPRASAVRRDLPEALNGVLGKGMAAESQSRYATAQELVRAARDALVPTPNGRTAPSPTDGKPGGKSRTRPADNPTTTKAMPADNTQRPARRASAVLAVLALIGAAGVGWWWWPDSDQREIQVGTSPEAIQIGPDGASAYVANRGSDSVSVVDLVGRTVASTIPVGDQPVAIALARDGKRAYVANHGSGSVSVIDLGARTVAATVPVGAEPSDIALTLDGSRVFVSNANSVSVIDTKQDIVSAEIDVNSLPWDASAGVAVSPDGTRVLATLPRGLGRDDVVVVLDPLLNRVVRTVKVGDDPDGVAISSDGRSAYVANTSSGSMSVIDLSNGAVTTDVPVGSEPTDVVLSPDGQRAFVTNSGSGTVTAIDTRSNLVLASLTGGGPMAISPDGRQAYMVDPGSAIVSAVELK